MEMYAMREYLRIIAALFYLCYYVINTNTNLILTLLHDFVQNYIYIYIKDSEPRVLWISDLVNYRDLRVL